MRAINSTLALAVLLAGCRIALPAQASQPNDAAPADAAPADAAPAERRSEPARPTDAGASEDQGLLATLGQGATPGSAKGPGGFVPRGSARNFYTGRGGRLWYYMNNYYWVPDTAPREDLWIKADVREIFSDLKKWPKGNAVAAPPPKVTVEYWEVGVTGRTVRLDNHRDFCLLSDEYSAGSINVEVTLTLGHLVIADKRGRWGPSKKAYVLESRNYSTGGGIGPDRARFTALRTEAVTVWGYRVPWNTHPQRLTRSNWQDLSLPTWKLDKRLPPPTVATPEPVVTPSPAAPEDS